MDCGAECNNIWKQQQREHTSTIELMSCVLSRAFLEWILMFLLYINAIFSFLVTQFARLCELQTPCVLCSRLDHILLPGPAHEIDLICHSHKKKISDLTYIEKKHDSTFHSSSLPTSKHCSCCSASFQCKSPPPQTPTIDKCTDDDDNDDKMIVKNTMENSDSNDHQFENANQLSDNIDENHEERRHYKRIEPEPVSLIAPSADTIVDSTPLDSETASKRNSESMDDKLTGSGNLITRTSTSDPDAITSQTTGDIASNMDLNDAYKLATGSKSSSIPSPRITQVITGMDSSKVYEDLRLLVSQFSAARGLESPWAELSPSPRVLHDPSNNAILEHITKSLSIDRNNEYGLESLDRSSSIVSEVEGESVVDRLKRQVELDRKSMYLLYKELEEERNASAVAAYQAMAMITRLQEEKASMHMEALQYQRMMEEQSEYDQEAVLKLNEVVIQREKEMLDLEAQLDRFRKKVGDDFVLDNVSDETFVFNSGCS